MYLLLRMTFSICKSQIPHKADYVFSPLFVPRASPEPVNGSSLSSLLKPEPRGKYPLEVWEAEVLDLVDARVSVYKGESPNSDRSSNLTSQVSVSTLFTFKWWSLLHLKRHV